MHILLSFVLHSLSLVCNAFKLPDSLEQMLEALPATSGAIARRLRRNYQKLSGASETGNISSTSNKKCGNNCQSLSCSRCQPSFDMSFFGGVWHCCRGCAQWDLPFSPRRLPIFWHFFRSSEAAANKASFGVENQVKSILCKKSPDMSKPA